jgi:predicted TIM-barrel fold metal-dependent hydrolase
MAKVGPKFTAVDVHTHLDNDGAKKAIDIMDSVGVAAMVNLTSGTTTNFKPGLKAFAGRNRNRFAACVMLDFKGLDDKNWAKRQADGLERAVKAGAAGLKEVKRLGLDIRFKNGELLRIDDPRLDVIWERCGELNVPFWIHVSDPLAFHKPLHLTNERCVELQVHPDWYFNKPGLPSKYDLLKGLNRVIKRHPKTRFICVHFGGLPEDPVTISHWLDEMPNMYIDLAARFVEFGRHHPEMMRNFFIRHQNRILFGTDTGVWHGGVMLGVSMPADVEFAKRPDFKKAFLLPHFDAMYRYLETDDYYLPAPSPVQGTWPIHGVSLPDSVLRKVYAENAVKVIPALEGKFRLRRR